MAVSWFLSGWVGDRRARRWAGTGVEIDGAVLLAAAGDCPHGVEIVALVGERLQEQVQRFGPHQGRAVDHAFTEVEDAVDDSIRGFEVLVEVDGRFGDDGALLRVNE